MKKALKKTTTVTLAVLLAASLLSGCGAKKAEAPALDGTKTLVTVNGKDFSLGTANLLLRYQQAYQEQQYLYYYSVFGYDTTNIAIWDQQVEEGVTYGSQFKDSIVNQLELMEVLKEHASDYDITVSEEEEAAMAEAAAKFMADNSEETIADLAVTEANVKEFLELQTYAEKVYSAVRESFDITVTDEEAQTGAFTYASLNISGDDITEDDITTRRAEMDELLASLKGNVTEEAATEEAAAEEATEEAAEEAATEEAAAEEAAEEATTEEAATEEATEEVATEEAAAEEATEEAATEEAAAEEATEGAAAEEAAEEAATEKAAAEEAATEEATAEEAAEEATEEAATEEAAAEESAEEEAEIDFKEAAAAVDSAITVLTGNFVMNPTEDDVTSSTYPEEVLTALRGMEEEGAYYDAVIEGTNPSTGTTALYIIRLDAKTDEAQTETRRQNLDSSRRQTAYTDLSNEWVEAAEITVNEEVLATLTVSDAHKYSIVTPASDLTEVPASDTEEVTEITEDTGDIAEASDESSEEEKPVEEEDRILEEVAAEAVSEAAETANEAAETAAEAVSEAAEATEAKTE